MSGFNALTVAAKQGVPLALFVICMERFCWLISMRPPRKLIVKRVFVAICSVLPLTFFVRSLVLLLVLRFRVDCVKSVFIDMSFAFLLKGNFHFHCNVSDNDIVIVECNLNCCFIVLNEKYRGIMQSQKKGQLFLWCILIVSIAVVVLAK